MNYVITDGFYITANNGDVAIEHRIPVGTWTLIPPSKNPMNPQPEKLVKTPDLPKPCKLYGSTRGRADMTMRSFDHREGSMGILCEGAKGTGKTMMSNELAHRFLESGDPVIVIRTPYEGMDSYLGSINQRCMILFDEFDKTFRLGWRNKDNGSDAGENIQESLLGLFDGVSGAHHLNVLTFNEERNVDDLYKNRPGRFLYRFRFTCPKVEDVRMYLEDNLPGNDAGEWATDEWRERQITDVEVLSAILPFSYDALSAVVEALRYGGEIKDLIDDLNIMSSDSDESSLRLKVNYSYALDNGEVIECVGKGFVDDIDLVDTDDMSMVPITNLRHREAEFYLPVYSKMITDHIKSGTPLVFDESDVKVEEKNVTIHKLTITKIDDSTTYGKNYWGV